MTRKRSGAWLVALCAVAGFGCAGDGKTQVLTGRVGTQGAIAVRAVVADSVVTAAQVRSDGSFTIALPAGRDYRLRPPRRERRRQPRQRRRVHGRKLVRRRLRRPMAPLTKPRRPHRRVPSRLGPRDPP
jgi:hypothetical protein